MRPRHRRPGLLEVEPVLLLDLAAVVVHALVVALGRDQDVYRRPGAGPPLGCAGIARRGEDRADRAHREPERRCPLDELLPVHLARDEPVDRILGRRVTAIDALAHATPPSSEARRAPRARGELTT